MFWRLLVSLKDLLWVLSLLARTNVDYLTYLVQNLKESKPFLLGLLPRRASSTPLIAFDMFTTYFFENYYPLYVALKDKYPVYFICEDSVFKERRAYLESRGIPRRSIIPSNPAYFIDWRVYINCWLPEYPLNLLRKKSGVYKVQMYHGAGTAIFKKNDLIPQNVCNRQTLKEFNVHFMVGPQYSEIMKSLGGGIESYTVGYPKLDRIFNNPSPPVDILREVNFRSGKPVIVYAPHHKESFSLGRYGLDVVKRLLALDVNVIVKLHHYMLVNHPLNWVYHDLTSMEVQNPRLHVAKGEDSTLYFPLADVVVTDVATNAGLEAAICGKPVILINSDGWFDVYGRDSVEYEMKSLFPSVDSLDELDDAVAYCLSGKYDAESVKDAVKRYYYNPGHATEKAVAIIDLLVKR